MANSKIPVLCSAVAAVILRNRMTSPEVLLMQRAKGVFAGYWCLTTGRIEANESAWEAAAREIREESGIEPDAMYSADFCDHFYNPVDDLVEVIPIFVATVRADDPVRLNSEHLDYRWVSFDQAIKLVPFTGHRQVLREVERLFVKQEPMEWLRIVNYPGGTPHP